LGIQSRNLDLFFTDENTVKYLFARNAESAGVAVLEGVMGYYDGLAGRSSDCSSYDLARKTGTPVILVADCKGMSVSVAALVKGFTEMRRDHGIHGVILNRIPPALYEDIKSLIEEETALEVLGYLPDLPDCRLESRHLGLVTAKEIGNLKDVIDRLAGQVEATVNLNRILMLSEEVPPLVFEIPDKLDRIRKNRFNRHEAEGPVNKLKNAEQSCVSESAKTVKIAVAMDQAFCFYYRDNLELLEELGAELVPFSPLEDRTLPEETRGLILGGGYPELYLEQLSKNDTMLQSIRQAVDRGIPCIAECGGFMYLHQWIADRKGAKFRMVGVIEGESYPVGRLTRFGYITLTALEDNLLCKKGDILKGHEFHYWDSTETGNSFRAQKPLRKAGWDCIIARGNLWAGYPHIHFYSNLGSAAEFIRKAREAEPFQQINFEER
jgi:cobyrinic acid a,c-diamide synthase